MFSFGRRQVDRDTLATLTAKIEKLTGEMHVTQSALRTLESEQIEMHDRVRKWMRRAVAAERNQERAAPDAAATPEPATGRPKRWGALARIAARGRSPARAETPADDSPPEGEQNGVHA